MVFTSIINSNTNYNYTGAMGEIEYGSICETHGLHEAYG